jgi:hypothetical protein
MRRRPARAAQPQETFPKSGRTGTLGDAPGLPESAVVGLPVPSPELGAGSGAEGSPSPVPTESLATSAAGSETALGKARVPQACVVGTNERRGRRSRGTKWAWGQAGIDHSRCAIGRSFARGPERLEIPRPGAHPDRPRGSRAFVNGAKVDGGDAGPWRGKPCQPALPGRSSGRSRRGGEFRPVWAMPGRLLRWPRACPQTARSSPAIGRGRSRRAGRPLASEGGLTSSIRPP